MRPAAGSSIDPEGALVERAIRERGDRVAFGCVADTRPAGETLIRRAAGHATATRGWPRCGRC